MSKQVYRSNVREIAGFPGSFYYMEVSTQDKGFLVSQVDLDSKGQPWNSTPTFTTEDLEKAKDLADGKSISVE